MLIEDTKRAAASGAQWPVSDPRGRAVGGRGRGAQAVSFYGGRKLGSTSIAVAPLILKGTALNANAAALYYRTLPSRRSINPRAAVQRPIVSEHPAGGLPLGPVADLC
ncbi:hypothetical protein EVAR_61465_1 [Eumeta japonica]|uniref:Uncharacterized protein n=1 Tax=Eumeta variegata TaxID=151549 RepID=A0A4C1Z6A6_EUMVA|nr:hypothetical protein EVAR_61465_1 [Eumeta japonica]